MSEAVQLELLRGLIGLLTPVLAAILLYLVGRYLTDRYNEQKKRAELILLQASQSAQKQRELQLQAAARFYQLYGEFFGIWKIWTAFKSGKVPEGSPPNGRAELYRRACAAEGEMEAVLVRLVVEFRLDPPQVEALGKFRQGYQSLREAIRSDRDVGWHSASHPEYAAFKRLACSVASMLTRQAGPDMPSAGEAAAALQEVTANKWEEVWANVTEDPGAGKRFQKHGSS
jgi:hypothetical protein